MRLFHTLLYPLLGLLCLSCSDDEQETGNNPALNSGAITFGVDLTGFTTRITQDGTSWTNGDKIGTYVLNAETNLYRKPSIRLMSAQRPDNRWLLLRKRRLRCRMTVLR